ncbi:MAG: hypothetical protein MZV65_32175 [Chromatiales bacterium]|nr:hypothetical protein [Chromatiales bacterium]
MFLIIGVWGGPRRVYATFKFFLYTFLGSVLMLVALIYAVSAGRQLPTSRTAAQQAAAAVCTSRCWSSSPSSLASRSRCRCGRCTPGCRTRTSRRRPAAR